MRISNKHFLNLFDYYFFTHDYIHFRCVWVEENQSFCMKCQSLTETWNTLYSSLIKQAVSINPACVKQHVIKKGLLKVGGWPVHSLKLYFQVKYLQRGRCHFDEMGNCWLKSWCWIVNLVLKSDIRAPSEQEGIICLMRNRGQDILTTFVSFFLSWFIKVL